MGKMRPKLGRHIDPAGLSGVLRTDGTTISAEEQLAIVRGGTGASTAPAARVNLGAASAADLSALTGDLETLQSRWIYTASPLSGGGRLADGDLTLTISKAGASDSGWLSAADWRSFAGQGDFMVRSRSTNLSGITAGHLSWTAISIQRPSQASISVTNAEKTALQPGGYRVIATVRVTATSQVDCETVIYTGAVGTSVNTDIVESRVRETAWSGGTQTLNSVAYIHVAAGAPREVGIWISRASGTGTITVVGYSQITIERIY